MAMSPLRCHLFVWLMHNRLYWMSVCPILPALTWHWVTPSKERQLSVNDTERNNRRLQRQSSLYSAAQHADHCQYAIRLARHLYAGRGWHGQQRILQPLSSYIPSAVCCSMLRHFGIITWHKCHYRNGSRTQAFAYRWKWQRM